MILNLETIIILKKKIWNWSFARKTSMIQSLCAGRITFCAKFVQTGVRVDVTLTPFYPKTKKSVLLEEMGWSNGPPHVKSCRLPRGYYLVELLLTWYTYSLIILFLDIRHSFRTRIDCVLRYVEPKHFSLNLWLSFFSLSNIISL